VGALTADREALLVANATVALDVDQTLDVHGDLLAEISFNLVGALDDVADCGDLNL
jgi:hypothetical protein